MHNSKQFLSFYVCTVCCLLVFHGHLVEMCIWSSAAKRRISQQQSLKFFSINNSATACLFFANRPLIIAYKELCMCQFNAANICPSREIATRVVVMQLKRFNGKKVAFSSLKMFYVKNTRKYLFLQLKPPNLLDIWTSVD